MKGRHRIRSRGCVERLADTCPGLSELGHVFWRRQQLLNPTRPRVLRHPASPLAGVADRQHLQAAKQRAETRTCPTLPRSRECNGKLRHNLLCPCCKHLPQQDGRASDEVTAGFSLTQLGDNPLEHQHVPSNGDHRLLDEAGGDASQQQQATFDYLLITSMCQPCAVP